MTIRCALASVAVLALAGCPPLLAQEPVAGGSSPAAEPSRLATSQSVACSGEGAAALRRAESLFAADRHADAIPVYEAACAQCPASAECRMGLADAHFMLGNYAKAREGFRAAIGLDPWYRLAHRYLADTESRLGAHDAALREAALAIVSDPSYELAWGTLRDVAAAGGRPFHRVVAHEPRVTTGEDGRMMLDVSLGDPEASRAETAGPAPDASQADAAKVSDGAFWIAYGRALGLARIGSTFTVDDSGEMASLRLDPKSMSELETKRAALFMAVRIVGEMESPGPVGAMLQRAEVAGFLDEAIVLHLHDDAIAAGYPAFRATNADRLVAYLETVIVPRPVVPRP